MIALLLTVRAFRDCLRILWQHGGLTFWSYSACRARIEMLRYDLNHPPAPLSPTMGPPVPVKRRALT